MIFLPSEYRCSPSQPRSKCDQQKIFSRLYASFAYKFIESNSNRGSRRIAIFMNRQIDPLHRYAKPLSNPFNNSDVGLMRHDPADLRLRKSSLIQTLLGSHFHPPHSMFVGLFSTHLQVMQPISDRLFASWPT